MAAPASANAQERPGFCFLSCPDTQMLLEAVDAQAKAWAGNGQPLKRVTFWGDEPPSDAFWECLSVRDLFGSMRLVLVRQANNWKAETWKLLDKLLARPLTGSYPVFCLENEWDRHKLKVPATIQRLACFKFAQKKGWFWSSPGITDKTAQGYVSEQAKARGLKLAPGTLTSLVQSAPHRAGVLAAELDKLALLAEPGQPVPPAMLATADWSPEAESFDCINHLMRGNARGVWEELAKMTDLGSTALGLLGLVAWKFRAHWLVLVGDEQPRFGVSMDDARRMGHAGLSRAMELVLDAEIGIKTGMDPRQMVEMTFMKLLTITGAGRQQGYRR